MTEIEKIYREYFNDVFLYMKGLSGNAQIAEDMTAETFFRAMNALDSFHGRCDIRVWLCQIAKNCYFSYLRKSKRLVPVDEIDDLADTADFAHALVDAELSVKLHEFLHSLAEPYKEVFSLRVFGELGFKQIAALFGKSENWACVTFHRAKAQIRERMEEYL